MLDISDLIRVIEDEFDVNVWIEEQIVDSLDIKSLAEDATLFQQIQQSRDDRKSDRVFEQQAGLDYLRKKTEVFEREQKV